MKERIICESIESLRQEGLRFSVDTLAEKLNIIGMVLLPFIIGIAFGFLASIMIKSIKRNSIRICFLILFLVLSAISGLLIDFYIFHSFKLNYLLIGLAFSATIAVIVAKYTFKWSEEIVEQ